MALLNRIPFNRPVLAGKEVEYLLDSIRRMHVSGDGYYTAQCHQLLERLLGVPKVLLTTSCTHALEMTALLLEVSTGDEVILPSFTFVSMANAFALRGAKPVFVDIRRDTLNIDENLIQERITPRTKAIVVVHYAGVACEMDTIRTVAANHGIRVVEDNAHGFMGRYKGRALGTLTDLATLSFHETKNFTCGEGGALIMNAPEYIERAEVIREKGTDRSRFFRGLVDKYSWVAMGSSYLPSDILSGFLLAQLEARDCIQQARRRAWEFYEAELSGWAEEHGIHLPVVPSHCEQPYHLFYLLLPSLAERQAMIAHLEARNISSVFHYLPLHLSAMGRTFGGREGDCPVTEDISDRLLRLPLYNDLTLEDQARVVEGLKSFDAWAAPQHRSQAT
jgi:dTDP-4-amino-4,6-dideoxygalactose transaminase